MDKMDWWFEYFTDSRKLWVYYRAREEVIVELNHDQFEQYFSQAEAEMAEGVGQHLMVSQDVNGTFRVAYTDRRGTCCNPEVRWWVVRRIRSFAEATARRGDPVAPGGPDNPTDSSTHDGRLLRPEGANLSLCTVVAEFFRRIDACLRTLTPRELLAVFHDMRFSDHTNHALPDECAPTILSAYDLADGNLCWWWENNPQNRRAQHRFQGRQRLENCMIGRHGPHWRTYALDG